MSRHVLTARRDQRSKRQITEEFARLSQVLSDERPSKPAS